jgi:paraquat-inducible protein B
MSAESRYFRVGAFVLGGIGLGIAALLVIGGGSLFQRPVVLESYFAESVQGLDIGSPVKLRGVAIGTVKEIGFVGDHYEIADAAAVKYRNLVLVRMEILRGEHESRAEQEHRLDDLIAQGLRLQIAPSGITGTSFVQANFLDPAKYPPMQIDWKPEELYVPSAPSTISQLSTAAERLMSRLDKLDLEGLLTHFDTLLVTANQAIAEADVAGIHKSVSAVLDEGRQTMAEARRSVAALDAKGVGSDARQALGQMTSALARLQTLLDSGSDDLTAALENLRVASENLRAVSETARSYPSLLLFGGPPKPVAGSKP